MDVKVPKNKIWDLGIKIINYEKTIFLTSFHHSFIIDSSLTCIIGNVVVKGNV